MDFGFSVTGGPKSLVYVWSKVKAHRLQIDNNDVGLCSTQRALNLEGRQTLASQ